MIGQDLEIGNYKVILAKSEENSQKWSHEFKVKNKFFGAFVRFLSIQLAEFQVD